MSWRENPVYVLASYFNFGLFHLVKVLVAQLLIFVPCYSCPFFRNELGGEGERVVSLSRDWGCGSRPASSVNALVLYRPVTASTIGLLEPAIGQSHWRSSLCPYMRIPLTIEAVDQGASYYLNYFSNHGMWSCRRFALIYFHCFYSRALHIL